MKRAHALFYKSNRGDAWLAQSVEPVTLDLGVVSLSPASGVQFTKYSTIQYNSNKEREAGKTALGLRGRELERMVLEGKKKEKYLIAGT